MLPVFADPLVFVATLACLTTGVVALGVFANVGAQTFLRRDISECLGKGGAALLLVAALLIFVPSMPGRIVLYTVVTALVSGILAMGAFVSQRELEPTNPAFRFAVMLPLALLCVFSVLLLFGILSWATHFTWLG